MQEAGGRSTTLTQLIQFMRAAFYHGLLLPNRQRFWVDRSALGLVLPPAPTFLLLPPAAWLRLPASFRRDVSS